MRSSHRLVGIVNERPASEQPDAAEDNRPAMLHVLKIGTSGLVEQHTLSQTLQELAADAHIRGDALAFSGPTIGRRFVLRFEGPTGALLAAKLMRHIRNDGSWLQPTCPGADGDERVFISMDVCPRVERVAFATRTAR